MILFQHTYRAESHRKPHRDYADVGRYFVTICTEGRATWFGTVRNGIMGLNDNGCIVADEIQCTHAVRPYVAIDDWIVMPNHVHMIVTIRPFAIGNRDAGGTGGQCGTMAKRNATVVDASRRDASTRVCELIPLFRFRPRSLGSVVNHIKSASTRRIRTAGFPDFAWQRNYHDRIIRSNAEWYRIRRYIRANAQCRKTRHE